MKNGKNTRVAMLHFGFELQYLGRILDPFIVRVIMIHAKYAAAKT